MLARIFFLPCELIRAGAGQQHGLLGNIGHGVTQRVGKVHGVVDSRVVELHVDGVVLLVVVAPYDAHRVPHLRRNLAVSTAKCHVCSPSASLTMKRCVRCAGVEPG